MQQDHLKSGEDKGGAVNASLFYSDLVYDERHIQKSKWTGETAERFFRKGPRDLKVVPKSAG